MQVYRYIIVDVQEVQGILDILHMTKNNKVAEAKGRGWITLYL